MKRIIYSLLLSLIIASCLPRPTPLPLPPEATTTPSFATMTPDADQPVSTTPGENVNPIPENPYAPKPGDEKLHRANVIVEEYGILTMESFPLQFSLQLSGTLPDPCHELRVILNSPNTENRIDIEVYSVVDPNMICIQVIKPFSANIPLGSFPAGHYTVWLNGEMISEFDA